MALAVVASLALAVVGYSKWTASSLDGTWLKTQGSPDVPSELTARLTTARFSLRYSEAGGVEHITFLLDGNEHPLWSVGVLRVTYRATLDGNAVLVTKHIMTPAAKEVDVTERWSVATSDRKLIVSGPGEETVFRPAPFLRTLFVADP